MPPVISSEEYDIDFVGTLEVEVVVAVEYVVPLLDPVIWYLKEQEADTLVLVKEQSKSRATVTVPTLSAVEAVYFPVKLKVVEP
jgi:hypothetical protein